MAIIIVDIYWNIVIVFILILDKSIGLNRNDINNNNDNGNILTFIYAIYNIYLKLFS